MSVASIRKTKMFTTVVLGFVAALSILPTWASTTPGIDSLTTVTPVVSTPSNQDLSELRVRLKERFSWVATEIRSLITTNTVSSDADDVLSRDENVRIIDVRQGIGVQPLVSLQNSFVDIENDPYKTYINRLADYGVLSPTQRFSPQNYFRVDDFLSLLTKLYKKSIGQSLTSQDILWLTSVDGLMTKEMLQQVMYSLKNIDTITINGNPYDKLIRSEWAYYLVRMFDISSLDTDKDSFASIGDMFTDISNQRFAPAINILASLGIVNVTIPKFYPGNYIRHYDFVILLINSLLTSKNQSLPTTSLISPFSDVDNDASYLPQLSYAADHGIVDRITMSQWGQLYFEPNKFVTKHDVYHIFPKLLPIQFIHDDAQADQQKISRAELAQLLVESFKFEPKTLPDLTESWWALLDTGDMSVLMKLKILLSML